MQINEENIIEESMIPMNFDFKQAKQVYQNNLTGQDGEFNPMVNMNDPMVAAQMAAKKKRDEESAKQQRIENYKQHSRNILYKVITSINNLIKGHSHPNFTESHQQLLCISITNKVKEILNENKLLIDNKILLNTLLEMQVFMKEEYSTNIKRYNLMNTSTCGFNPETGTVMINPDYLFDIVRKWVSENTMHYQEGDEIILS